MSMGKLRVLTEAEFCRYFHKVLKSRSTDYTTSTLGQDHQATFRMDGGRSPTFRSTGLTNETNLDRTSEVNDGIPRKSRCSQG
jgi:hypothetical protein